MAGVETPTLPEGWSLVSARRCLAWSYSIPWPLTFIADPRAPVRHDMVYVVRRDRDGRTFTFRFPEAHAQGAIKTAIRLATR